MDGTSPVRPWWFDGHLDLTYIADHGRDLTSDVEHCGGGLWPASITFPSLRAGNVRAAVSTIFVRRRVDGAAGAPPLDGPYCFASPDEAYAAAVRQLRMHQAWQAEGSIRVLKGDSPAEFSPIAPLQTVLAIEGAACLRDVEDLAFFYDAGVRVVSLAWAEGSAWAGGDQSGGGITAAGRQLIRELDRLGCIHDVSHLSEVAFWELLAERQGRVVASHSNCRALLPGAKHPERHLSDEQIRALAKAGGVIGINLFARFLIPAEELKKRRATIADVARHMEHIAQVAGTREVLALGSDMDSGFTTEFLPADLQSPKDLARLAEALSGAGWTDPEIDRFAQRWTDILVRE